MIPEHYRRLQIRQSSYRDQIGPGVASSLPATTGPAFVGSVCASPPPPTTTGAYFAVNPVSILGTEGEGLPGTKTVDTTKTIVVYVVGSLAPVAGDLLVCRFIGSRWVAERMTKHQNPVVTVPGCPCTSIPVTLHMTSSRPQSNNGIFQNATFAYGPTPAAFNSLSIGPNCFLSTTSFPDQNTGDLFWYYFFCNSGYYAITRLYQTSVFGTPYRDVLRYLWLVGLPGNTCSPFLLSNGQIYSGGDATCKVTISS